MKILKKDIEKVKEILKGLNMSVKPSNYSIFMPLADETATTNSAMDLVMTSKTISGYSGSAKPGLVIRAGDVSLGFVSLDYQYKFPYEEALGIGVIKSDRADELVGYDFYLVPTNNILIEFDN